MPYEIDEIVQPTTGYRVNIFTEVLCGVDSEYSSGLEAQKHFDRALLSVEEHTFFWRERCADEEINLVSQIIKPLIMLQQAPVNAVLNPQQPLIDAVASQKIVFQDFIGPYAELSATNRFYPITD